MREPTWRRALRDTNRAIHTSQLWITEAMLVAIGAVLAVIFYPDNASAKQQAVISSSTIGTLMVALVILIFFANWVAFSARSQRDESYQQVDQLTDQQDWRALIREITDFIKEGNRAMEAYGRPSVGDSTRGLEFMNTWIPRVTQSLPDEYHADFESHGRKIFEGDVVWALQLDVRMERLREIVADIRNRHL
jgi:hypothetical protein